MNNTGNEDTRAREAADRRDWEEADLAEGKADAGPAFKPGDVVRLKTGGPLMTVAGPEFHGAHRVAWFDADGFHDIYLHRDCLAQAFN